MFLRPTFANIWASRLLTHCHQIMCTHQFACFIIGFRYRCFDAQPVRPARLRTVWIFLLFWVPFGAFAGINLGHDFVLAETGGEKQPGKWSVHAANP